MKAWLIIGLLVMTPSYPAEKQQHGTQEHQKETKKGPPKAAMQPIAAPPCQPTAQVEKDGRNNDAQDILYKAVSPETWPSWAVVVAGLGAILIAMRTLRVMESQAESTKIAATAARDSVALYIDKERARIGFEIVTDALPSLRGIGMIGQVEMWARYGVPYKITFSGSTEASDVEGLISARVSESRELVPDLSAGHHESIPIPRIISPHEELRPLYRAILWKTPFVDLTVAEIGEINEQKAFIHVFGVIRYRHLFGLAPETKFHYRWEVNWLGRMVGTDFGRWINCMPDEKADQQKS